MPIEFSCPGCRKVLRVADSAAGKKARCPDCSTVSDVPLTSQSSGAPSDFSSFGSGPGSSPGSGQPSWSSGNWSANPEATRPAGNAPEGVPPSNNPYAPNPTAPAGSAGNPFAPQSNMGPMSASELEAIREKVKGPAICLIVVSSIGIAISVASMAFQILTGAAAAIAPQNNGPGGPAELIMMMSFGVVPALMSLARNGFLIYGALQMKKLENHSISMAVAIIAVVPCFSACCLLDIPFGIWALVVLNDPGVKQAFQMSARQP